LNWVLVKRRLCDIGRADHGLHVSGLIEDRVADGQVVLTRRLSELKIADGEPLGLYSPLEERLIGNAAAIGGRRIGDVAKDFAIGPDTLRPSAHP
jgi:hypothetical protein